MLQEHPHCETPAQGTCGNQGTESTTEICTGFKVNNTTDFTIQAANYPDMLQATWR